MGCRRSVRQEMLIVAAFSRHTSALAWARTRMEELFGTIGIESEAFPFVQTDYYADSMGDNLIKRLFAFERLVDPATLADLKLQSNAWEEDLAASKVYPEPRPINLDPGLLSLGKFMLATTKDQAHRVYLRDGIFAEVTLRFQDKHFEPWPWTYADYRLPEVRAFLLSVRDYYRRRLAPHDSAGNHALTPSSPPSAP